MANSALNTVRPATRWCLVGCVPPANQQGAFWIDADGWIVGRNAESTFPIASPRVSGRHAELTVIGDHLFVRDLGSSNGTFLNGKRVTTLTPLASGDVLRFANVEFRVEEQREIAPVDVCRTFGKTFSDMEGLEADWALSEFDELIREGLVAPHFQPIVMLARNHTVAYEALARSHVTGLETPEAMFDMARLFDRETELSLVCRRRAAEAARDLPKILPVFVNTYPGENLNDDVLPSIRKMRQTVPEVPVVIEVHEATVLDPQGMREFHAALQHLDVKLAYGDFGAGRSRLMELVKSPPDFLKFDQTFIRNVDASGPLQLRMLRTLVDLVKEFRTSPIAEGVETVGEADACRDLGFDLAQGFFFGRPKAPQNLP